MKRKKKEFFEDFKLLKAKYCDNYSFQDRGKQKVNYDQIIGVTIPHERQIGNPTNIRNKGCGSRGKRLKSAEELTRIESAKKKRMCFSCKKMATHDSRNCPDKKKTN